MKKYLAVITAMMAIILVSVIGTTTVYAVEDPIVVEINEENFPDEVFRDFLRTGSINNWDEDGNLIEIVFDANQDGAFSESEIANIKQLLLAQLEIYDLTGIEYFTSLIELQCQMTQLRTLDVSKNTELVYLICSHSMLEGTLDLSNNTKLESLSCGGNPNLKAIDISKCKKLYSIACENTGITELDTGNNPELIAMECSATGITELDLSNNLKLRNLSCYYTGLTELDISNNPELEYVDCSDTKISELDISNNPNLTDISIYRTRIKGLDAGNNKALFYVNAMGGSLVWMNIGENTGLELLIDDGAITLTVPENSFDITEMLPGIDAGRITILSGASINGNIISGYSSEAPIVYTYNCGTSMNGEEILKATVTLNTYAAEHTAGDMVIENEVPVTCTEDGSYDEVYYCTDCGEELSRNTIVIPTLGEHSYGDTVIENEVPATCTEDGSYDEVFYCTACGEEIFRYTDIIPATGEHTPAKAVVENKVAATSTKNGSYDEVVYCSVCGNELSRKTVVVPATGNSTSNGVNPGVTVIDRDSREDEIAPNTGAPAYILAVALGCAAAAVLKDKKQK